MNSALLIEDLWKEYRIGGPVRRPETLYEVLSNFLHAPGRSLRRGLSLTPKEESFWALREIDLTIRDGEVVGIVGRNGAGKSTLLKILSRITEPTRGRVEIRGRLASLLEVGTGFHPMLTGRENIFLNGAILGMTRREIASKLDEIVAFAEVEKFLETPVKRYSSGMYVRLAFAVAAHLDPDILVVDEVLAVGDASFQKKCLAKMGEARGEGRTVLFVSHNMTAVQQLCSRAILLESGSVRADGTVAEIVSTYLSTDRECARVVWPRPEDAPGNERIRLRSIRVLSDGHETAEVAIDKEIQFEVEFWNEVDGIRQLAVCLYLRDAFGTDVLVTFNTDAASSRKSGWYQAEHAPGLYRATCTLPANLLNDQRYSLTVLVVSMTPWNPEAVAERALSFTVVDSGVMRESGMSGKWDGAVRVPLDWRTEQLSAPASTSDRGVR